MPPTAAVAVAVAAMVVAAVVAMVAVQLMATIRKNWKNFDGEISLIIFDRKVDLTSRAFQSIHRK